jgi:hypothetical protein
MTTNLPSLLSEIDVPVAAGRREPLARRLAAPLVGLWSRIGADPARKRRVLLAARVVGAVLLVGAGVGAYFFFRPVPKPDYLSDDLDDVLGYTLLTDEFNRLPVEERLKLIGQLVQRFKSLDAGDSVLLAGFAAGIAGSARDQLMENASRLAVDTWDKYAREYAKVPAENQEQYLDETFVGFTKMMEGIGGRVRNVSDEERLAEGRRQAQRDVETMRNPSKGPSNEALGRMYSFMNNDVGSHASPQQRVRGQQMMRDMVRRLRNQDIHTGKPK